MQRTWLAGLTVWSAMFCALPAAHAQFEGKTALSYYQMFSREVGWRAAFGLGMAVTRTNEEARFITSLQSQSWDAVILELPGDQITAKSTVLSLLRQHVDAGGRLLVNYNELDRWPQFQEFLGVSVVRDRRDPSDVFGPPPGNPLFGAGAHLLAVTNDEWADNGDDAVAADGGFVLARFDSPEGSPAVLLREDRAVIVNLFDWDSVSSGGEFSMAAREMTYLLDCRPDLEPDMVLDIQDFLVFQDLWAAQDRLANVDFDQRFTVFDFLEYQDEFAAGCS
jgi:hypothetical protein